MGLLKSLSPTIEIIDSRSTPAQFDYHVALLSMPLALKTDESTIPADIPYLRAEPDRIERWKLRLGDQGFKIGVAWQGSKPGTEIGRSFHVIWLHGISKVPGVRLISLQKNEGSEQVAALPEGMKVETLGDDFDCGPDAFLDTAAIMENLDLVITADTSIAHVAGALAVRPGLPSSWFPIGDGSSIGMTARGIRPCACSGSKRATIGQTYSRKWKGELARMLDERK